MCNICKFKFELPDTIKENAPEYSDKEVHAAYCRVIGILEALDDRGFTTRAKADSEEFHHHAKGSKCTEVCGPVNFIVVLGTKGQESVAVQFFLSAHNGVHVLSTMPVEGMRPMWDFHDKGDKPKPLVRIQKWVSDWINECMHNQRKIFLFCYYTDSDLDNDWQNKASMCIGEALHVTSSHSCSGANGRAMSVRRSMGIKLQKGKNSG